MPNYGNGFGIKYEYFYPIKTPGGKYIVNYQILFYFCTLIK